MGLYTTKKYNFKPYGCDEVSWFDIPLAIKEYLQNTQGQILKALKVRKWRDWERIDLSEESPENVRYRETTKARLFKSDPCLFAGDQGKAIARSKLCQPRYVLEATIPLDEIRGDRKDHDLRAVIILWGFKDGSADSDVAKALTVYNNYLDAAAKFSHFVHDGSSTSKDSHWAVGLKGKGFILSTSYLAGVCRDFKVHYDGLAQREGCPLNEVCKKFLGMNSKPIGVGFNVGSRVCKVEYNNADPMMLKVKKEDLRALTLEAFRSENPKAERKDVESDDESDSEVEKSFTVTNEEFYLGKLRTTYRKRQELHLAEKTQQQKQNPTTDPRHERPLVRDDDVCIHVIGLPGSLTAEHAFSATFGIFEERKVWRIPGTLFDVFEGKDRFYHRDQLVPIKSPVAGVSINYHGDLRLTSDRMEIIGRGSKFEKYRLNLTEAIDKAVSTIPELAILLLKSMLRSSYDTTTMKPQSKDYAAQYKAAFEAACGQDIRPLYPFARRAMGEDLIGELKFVPWPLDDWQMQILEDAGAYISIQDHARNCLSKADEVAATELPGLDNLNRCVRRLLPDLGHDVSVRDYDYSTPRALYRDGHILLAQPKPCKQCTKSKCSCWVGPALVRIMQEYDAKADLDNIFRVYNEERQLADEQELTSVQNQAQKTGLRADKDNPEETATDTELGEMFGIAAACDSADDQSENEPWIGGTTWQTGGNRRHAGARLSNPRTQSQNPGKYISTPTSFTRQRLTTRLKESGNQSNSADTHATTPAKHAQAMNAGEDKFEVTASAETILTAAHDIVEYSRAGDFASVHEQLTKLICKCAETTEKAHQALTTHESNGGQPQLGILETPKTYKRKRTR